MIDEELIYVLFNETQHVIEDNVDYRVKCQVHDVMLSAVQVVIVELGFVFTNGDYYEENH